MATGPRRDAGAAPAVAVALLTLAAVTALAATAGPAAPPVVGGVGFQQRADGSGLVDVHYDVFDPEGDPLTITLQARAAGEEAWNFPCRTVTGDVGHGVAPGTARHIVWDFGADGAGWEGEFQVRIVASDAGVGFRPHSPTGYGIIDWQRSDFTSERTIQLLARADIVVITASQLWDNPANEAARVVDRIKQINPACRVIGYVPTKVVYLNWRFLPPGTFGRDLWDRTLPYWVYTTTGDTAQDWRSQVIVDTLDPDCRDVWIHTLAEHQRRTVNKLDGVFWDYFAPSLWISPTVTIDGDPDMDGDGIGHWDDSDEMIAFRAAQVELVTTARDSLGEDFLQVFNGIRAGTDSAFAALADVIHYELFPTIQPYSQWPDDMRQALDPANPISLWNSRRWPRARSGLPRVWISNINQAYYVDHTGAVDTLSQGNMFRAIGLLTDVWFSWSDSQSYTTSWPDNPVSLGRPLGPAVVEGDRFSRDFEYGRVELDMIKGTFPVAFAYRIWENGRIVEEFDFPYHYP